MPEGVRLCGSACGLWRPDAPDLFSVCFPSPASIGASGDPEVARDMAGLVAMSAAEEGIPLLLTPDPARASDAAPGTRGFCFSDDPALNIRMTAAWIRGLQENGVGAVLRAQEETDPEACRAVLGMIEPCAVMGPGGLAPAYPEACRLAEKLRKKPDEFDWGMQHHQARKVARQGIVLLKNDRDLLPIRGNHRIAVIGACAAVPVFRAPGLPELRCTETLSALQAVRSVSPVTYAAGYRTDHAEPDEALIREAVGLASVSDAALVFAGTEACVSALPASQEALIRAVAKVQPNTAVMLHVPAPIAMPWAEDAAALAVSFPSGQAGGAADIDLLFGAVPFRGRLPFDFPGMPYRMGSGIAT